MREAVTGIQTGQQSQSADYVEEFTVRRSLKRHMDTAHEGAPIDE